MAYSLKSSLLKSDNPLFISQKNKDAFSYSMGSGWVEQPNTEMTNQLIGGHMCPVTVKGLKEGMGYLSK